MARIRKIIIGGVALAMLMMFYPSCSGGSAKSELEVDTTLTAEAETELYLAKYEAFIKDHKNDYYYKSHTQYYELGNIGKVAYYLKESQLPILTHNLMTGEENEVSMPTSIHGHTIGSRYKDVYGNDSRVIFLFPDPNGSDSCFVAMYDGHEDKWNFVADLDKWRLGGTYSYSDNKEYLRARKAHDFHINVNGEEREFHQPVDILINLDGILKNVPIGNFNIKDSINYWIEQEEIAISESFTSD